MEKPVKEISPVGEAEKQKEDGMKGRGKRVVNALLFGSNEPRRGPTWWIV